MNKILFKSFQFKVSNTFEEFKKQYLLHLMLNHLTIEKGQLIIGHKK